MARSSREKGARGEREVAQLLRDHGLEADRTPNSGGLKIPGDVYGVLGFHFEVKRHETLRLPAWIRQAEAECGSNTAVVVFRQNGGRWYASLPLDELAELIRLARP